MNSCVIIFDLDGTLIDSAPSILNSMNASFESLNIQPCKALTTALIGPPLAETMSSVLHDEYLKYLPQLINEFKAHYDEYGYKETRVYDGVTDVLSTLRLRGYKLIIATNKRIIPTRRIIDMLGWRKYFAEIYALDFFNPMCTTKAEMLNNINSELKNITKTVTYVGDRLDDAGAAQKAEMQFLLAKWGYGNDMHNIPENMILQTPNQLLNCV